MKLGKIAGIDFRLNYFFLLLCVLYGYLGLLTEILIIIASVLIHELAHTVIASLLGIKVNEIEILPFGGQAKIEDFTGLDPQREIYVAVAGPLISLSLAAIFYFLLPNHDQPNVQLFITFNLFLGLFNFFPALPLDGGRVVRAVLSTVLGYKKATQRVALLGKITAVGIIGYGAYLTYINMSGANYLVIGVLLFWSANREGKLLAYAFMRYIVNKKGELSREGLLPSKQVVSQPDTLIKKILDFTRPTFYMVVVTVNDKHEITGMRTEAELIECLFEKGPGAQLRDC